MRQIEEYLDKAMAAARLAPADAGRVRAELREHLMTLIEAEVARSITHEEAWTMVEKEFGDPQQLGKEIARAKGRFLTVIKRRTRKLALTLATLAAVVFSVKALAAPYRLVGTCVAPYAYKGSLMFVNRMASAYHPNDLAVFRNDENLAIVGIVKSVGANGDLVIARNGKPDQNVAHKNLIGRVFLQTR